MEVIKPSEAQMEVLKRAMTTMGRYDGRYDGKPVGRIDLEPSSATQAVLKQHGWIAEDLYIRDQAERCKLSQTMEDLIGDVRDSLAPTAEHPLGDWPLAKKLLYRVSEIHSALERKCQWITESGIAEVIRG